MIDPIDVVSVTAAQPVQPPAPRERQDPPEAQARTTDDRQAAPSRPEPYELEIQRGNDGVFVYTLSDSATGRLVAVIPQGTEARTAGNYASGGWVDLTA